MSSVGTSSSNNNVAALKGYCGVATPAGIPTIWDSFQQTKEIALHCHSLRVGMSQWSKTTGKDIDKAPFFMEQTIKDIMGLNFNPGEAVRTFSSAQRGISILTCHPKSAHDVELQGSTKGNCPHSTIQRSSTPPKKHHQALPWTTTSNYASASTPSAR